jgi:hypothetical protein
MTGVKRETDMAVVVKGDLVLMAREWGGKTRLLLLEVFAEQSGTDFRRVEGPST